MGWRRSTLAATSYADTPLQCTQLVLRHHTGLRSANIVVDKVIVLSYVEENCLHANRVCVDGRVRSTPYSCDTRATSEPLGHFSKEPMKKVIFSKLLLSQLFVYHLLVCIMQRVWGLIYYCLRLYQTRRSTGGVKTTLAVRRSVVQNPHQWWRVCLAKVEVTDSLLQW